MKIIILALVLTCSTTAFAQHTFDLKDASKFFDIRVVVEKCDDLYCEGASTFSFYKKGAAKPYQVIDLPDTIAPLAADGKPLTNITQPPYGTQSLVNVGDFNFDGMEDVALCDGPQGSYAGMSYRIYLSSRAVGKFVYNKGFSDLAHHLGMFIVDEKKKTIQTFDKSTCCWHITERYSVLGGRPVKNFEETEDTTVDPHDNKMLDIMITTKTRVNGKWRTRVKYVKRVNE